MMTYYLGLGSNLGDREAILDKAVRLIGERIGSVIRRSSDYQSEPWGFASEHAFLNICVAVESELPPSQVLDLTQEIERELGRTQKSGIDPKTGKPVYHDRTIDIDLLRAYQDSRRVSGDAIHADEDNGKKKEIRMNTPRLILPHPYIEQRDFVRIPLTEIAE